MHKSTKVGGVTTTMPDREAAQGVGSCWMPLVVREEPILGCDIVKQMLGVTLCLSSSLLGHVQLTKDGGNCSLCMGQLCSSSSLPGHVQLTKEGELLIVHGEVVFEFFPPGDMHN